jgi:hypothetical protein
LTPYINRIGGWGSGSSCTFTGSPKSSAEIIFTLFPI